MKKRFMLVMSIVVLLVFAVSTSIFAESYEDRFMELYSDIMDPGNGYLSEEGIPYHSIETLIVEAPDYGHVTTSEAFSYYIWLEAMHGKFTGDFSGVDTAWSTMEEYIIPDEQTGLSNYNPNEPATYAPEYEEPDYYPAELDFDAPVGSDPLHNELRSTYGTDEIYGMHWLLDVDNWYGYGGQGSTDPVYINTFQRGEEESAWETVPHPSIEEFEYGGEYGFLDLFTGDENYARQWRYTNAPDADARAIQAAYWAKKWADEEGGNLSQEIVDNAAKMGDYLRYSFFDKYFKEIGCENVNAGGSDYDSAHYLLSWYYSWGGGIGASWSWKIGCSHSHFGYQNPMAAYILSEVPEFQPQSPNAPRDWENSFQRQLEFYTWLQSAEGAIAGGCSNSLNGRYESYPSGAATFYGMVYDEHPVYHDPGSNEWFGMQCWSMQRMAEVYLETGNQMAKNLLDKWVDWAIAEVKFEDGDFAIPGTLNWQGQPETWVEGSTSWENPNLHVTVTEYSQDLGVAGSLVNALVTYAAATQEHGQLHEEAFNVAKELIDTMWQHRSDKGIVVPEPRGDYSRFFEQEVYIPDGWRGEMANGDVIEPGVTFLDIRSKYLDDPQYDHVRQAYESGQDPVMEYHRFWAQCDIAIALGTIATYFPDAVPDESGNGGNGGDVDLGDINNDGNINSMDYILLRRHILNITEITNADGLAAADINQDGTINSLDYIQLRQLLQ